MLHENKNEILLLKGYTYTDFNLISKEFHQQI